MVIINRNYCDYVCIHLVERETSNPCKDLNVIIVKKGCFHGPTESLERVKIERLREEFN